FDHQLYEDSTRAKRNAIGNHSDRTLIGKQPDTTELVGSDVEATSPRQVVASTIATAPPTFHSLNFAADSLVCQNCRPCSARPHSPYSSCSPSPDSQSTLSTSLHPSIYPLSCGNSHSYQNHLHHNKQENVYSLNQQQGQHPHQPTASAPINIDADGWQYGPHGIRVLSLDGGGIRGLITIQTLRAIERAAHQPIRDLFDWIIGMRTSTGGIVALIIAHGKCLRYSRSLYFEFKELVFTGKRPYETESLESFMIDEFGESTTMTDLKPARWVTRSFLLFDLSPLTLSFT
ncbi:unnamed protein product, partial [Protopolystoma xenopodis]